MRHHLIAISIFIGIVPNLWAQSYRLQIGLYQDAVSDSYFDVIDGSESIRHELNHVGLHCYYIDGFASKDAAENKKLEIKSLNDRFLTIQVINSNQVAACQSACSKPVSTEKEIHLSAILFKSGSSRVRSEGRRMLRKIATYLKKHPNHTLLLEGHTDSVGDCKYNMKLAAKRAKSVRDTLSNRGIPNYRVIIDVYGESEPVAINKYDEELDSPESREYNRRVDLTILDGMNEPKYSSSSEKVIPLEFQIIEETIMAERPPEFLDPAASLNEPSGGLQ